MSCHQLLATCNLCTPECITCIVPVTYATPEGMTSMSCRQLLATCNLCYYELWSYLKVLHL